MWNSLSIDAMIRDPDSGYGEGTVLGFLPQIEHTATTTNTTTTTTTLATSYTTTFTTTSTTTTTEYTCPFGYTQALTSCYTIKTGDTWEDASYRCRREGGYLIEIESEEEEDVFIKVIDDNYVEDTVWIGLSYNDSVGEWVWEESGRLATDGYTDWAPDEPSGEEMDKCAGLQLYSPDAWNLDLGSWVRALHWVARECNSTPYSHPYICERPMEMEEWMWMWINGGDDDGLSMTRKFHMSIEALLGLSLKQVPEFCLGFLALLTTCFQGQQMVVYKLISSILLLVIPFFSLPYVHAFIAYISQRNAKCNLLWFLDDTDYATSLYVEITGVFFSTAPTLLLDMVILQNTRTDQILASQIVSVLVNILVILKTTTLVITFKLNSSSEAGWKAKLMSYMQGKLILLRNMMFYLPLVVTNGTFNISCMAVVVTVCNRLDLYMLYVTYFSIIYCSSLLLLWIVHDFHKNNNLKKR